MLQGEGEDGGSGWMLGREEEEEGRGMDAVREGGGWGKRVGCCDWRGREGERGTDALREWGGRGNKEAEREEGEEERRRWKGRRWNKK